MLNSAFKNARNLDLNSAMSIFVVMMGLLFYMDAAPGTHSVIALSMVLLGLVWYAGHRLLFRYYQAHHHHHHH